MAKKRDPNIVQLRRKAREKWLRMLRKPPKNIKQCRMDVLRNEGNGTFGCCGLGLFPIALGGKPVFDERRPWSTEVYYEMLDGSKLRATTFAVEDLIRQYVCGIPKADVTKRNAKRMTLREARVEQMMSDIIQLNDADKKSLDEIADFVQRVTRRC